LVKRLKENASDINSMAEELHLICVGFLHIIYVGFLCRPGKGPEYERANNIAGKDSDEDRAEAR
jgi:hypothetical protein